MLTCLCVVTYSKKRPWDKFEAIKNLMLLKSQLILMCFTSNVQAYVSTDAVGNSSALRQPSGGGLVKIPYRIFVGGIAFNVSS